MRTNEAESWLPDDSATQNLDRPVCELHPCWQAFVIWTAQVTTPLALKQYETSKNMKAIGIQCQPSYYLLSPIWMSSCTSVMRIMLDTSPALLKIHASKFLMKRRMQQRSQCDSLLLTLLSLGVLAYCSFLWFTLLAFRPRLNVHFIETEVHPAHCTVSKTMWQEGQ